MRKKLNIVMILVVTMVVNICLNVYAVEIKDVHIKWLNENTTFYLGADIDIQAYVNGGVSNEIQWKVQDLDGKSNVVSLSENGSKATIFANNLGRAEISAATIDDSNSMRHIVVNVDNYPQDALSQSIIFENIVPIQSRNLYSGKRLIQVEANKKISGIDRIKVVDKYLRNISTLGKLSLGDINSEHERYEYFTLHIDAINNIEIEFRVDKYDSSYGEIRSLIIDIEKYNNIVGNSDSDSDSDSDSGSGGTLPEGDKPNNDYTGNNGNTDSNNSNGNSDTTDNNSNNGNIVGSDVDKDDTADKENVPEYIVTKDEITQGIDEIIIIDGYGSDENPVRLEVNKNLSSSNKIESMDRFLKSLQKNKELDIIQKYETKEYTAYKIKVSNKEIAQILRATVKNDFFIEILVDKNDKKSYKPIIEMLDKLDKNYNSEENYTDNDSDEQVNNKQESTNNESKSVNGDSVNDSSNGIDKKNNNKDNNGKIIVDENSLDEQLNSIDDKNSENGVNVNVGVKGTGNRKEVVATILVAGGGLALGGSIFVGRKSFVRKGEERR